MSANDFLCLICDKVNTVLVREEYGGKPCADRWAEIYKLYSYYSSLVTGCELTDEYTCKLESVLEDFTVTTPTLTESITCAIAISKITDSLPSCPVITITKL